MGAPDLANGWGQALLFRLDLYNLCMRESYSLSRASRF
jgi:hypothetical protein